MELRTLGASRLEVSIVSLGTWGMGGDVSAWGPVDDNESIGTIQRALELGVNLIDTAPTYGAGHSEEIVGKAIRGRRESVLVATKCGPVPFGRQPSAPAGSLTRDNVVRECEASLRRLQTDYIDVYYCHCPDPETPISETMSALRLLLEQGTIRAIGLSNYSCEEVASAREFGPVHCLQPAFSMLQRRASDDLLPFCVEHDVATLAHSTLARGLLTGKFSKGSRIAGIRVADPEFIGARYRRNLVRIAKLAEIAAKYGKTVAQLAVQWVIRHHGVASAVVGAKRPSQIVENVGAAGWRLDPEDLTAIDAVLTGS